MKTSVLLSRIVLSFLTIIAAPDCDYFYSENLESEGFISSYNYPFSYRHNLACHYTFHFKYHDQNKICFKFYEFNLEPNVPYCLFDFLEFQSQPPIKYCTEGVWHYGTPDQAYPRSTLTPGYSCWTIKNSDKFVLKFSSDNSSNSRGFYATYKFLESVDADVSDRNDEKIEMGKSLMRCNFSWTSEEAGDAGRNRCSFDMEGWKKSDSLFLGSTFIDDHTIGAGGSFLLSSKNMKSILLFPEIPLNPDLQHCLTFWHLFASLRSPGLKVYLTKDQMHSNPEWELSPSNMTPVWRLAEISLSGLTAVQVAITTDVPDYNWSEGSLGLVALDDFAVSIGQCSGVDVSCNFESTNCDWMSFSKLSHLEGTLTANGDWKRHVVVSKTFSQEGNVRGSFISTLSPNDASLVRSLLISPQVVSAVQTWDLNSGGRGPFREGASHSSTDANSTSYRACFRFFYRFDKHDRLSVVNLRLIHHDDYLTQPVWSVTNGIQEKWVSAMADLVLHRDKPYKIIFEALLRTGSEVSLDGFYLESGGCMTPTSRCLSSNGHQCGSGQCIDASSICDGKEDCPDGSDEDETAGCKEGHLFSRTIPAMSTSFMEFYPKSSQEGISVVAAAVSAAVLGVVIACLALCVVCLMRRKKAMPAQRSNGPSRSDKSRGSSNRALGTQDDEGTIYQTLSASNQSSTNLCRANSEERGLRVARASSSSDDSSDLPITNVNESKAHLNSTHQLARRLDASLGSNLLLQSSAFQSMRGDFSSVDPLPHELDAQALRSQPQVPLIVTSKYIISPDRVGSFGPALTDRQRIDQMIESYRKDIKIPNTNTSALDQSSPDASKEFAMPPDLSLSDHVYEDIDDAKVKAVMEQQPYLQNSCSAAGVQHLQETNILPLPREFRGHLTGHFANPGSRNASNDKHDSSIISSAILV